MNFDELLEEHNKNDNVRNPKKIIFDGVSGKDVYNITSPFEDENETYIAGRVEDRDSEDSQVIFFKQLNETKYIKSDIPPLHLQDPFISKISGKIVIGGVYVEGLNTAKVKWRTDFYVGKSLRDLKLFCSGPPQMKDIRLAELPNGKVVVLTRPQFGKAELGKIGMTVLNSLTELKKTQLQSVDLLKNNIPSKCWGGSNQVISATEDKILVLGHLARHKDKNNLQYVALLFNVDLINKKILAPKIIATRSDFLPGPSKRNDLNDVIFSGGYDKEKGQIYVGTSDAEAQFATVKIDV